MNDIPVRSLTTPQPSDVFIAAEKKLIEYVNAQLVKMDGYAKLNSGQEPTFYEVNDALMRYKKAQDALLVTYNLAKFEHNRAKELFDDWYADKYLQVREILNPRSLSAQKWYSMKEIEMEIRVKYKEEYSKLALDLSTTEQQLSFMRRLLDNWAQYAFVLTQLSKNIIAEVKGLGVESSLENKED